jgi:hypothetical protein
MDSVKRRTWVQGKNRGEMPGDMATMVITLGYDPQKECYIGTFIGSRKNSPNSLTGCVPSVDGCLW